ncbi:DUF4214 domain-containing protein [Oxalobacteraceae bacterium A2-2]
MATTDDYSSDTSTTGVLKVGGSATGSMETASDRDWFKISLDAQTTYQFTVTTPSGGGWGTAYDSAPQLRVYDPALYGYGSYTGSSVGSSRLPVTWFKPTVSGDYYVDVSAYKALGGYQIQAQALARDDYADGPTTTAKLSVGGSASGVLELAADRDAFQLQLEAGVTYSLAASGVAGAAGMAVPVVEVYQMSQSGYWNSVAGGYNRSAVSFTATSSGSYYVAVSDRDTVRGIGAYTVSLSQPADDYAANASGAGVLTPGAAAVSGTLESSGDLDWFKIKLEANQAYNFKLTGASDMYFSMVDQLGNTLAGGSYAYNGNASFSWTAPRAGEYYVQVRGSGSSSSSGGAYTVKASLPEVDDFSASAQTSGLLAGGATIKGRLSDATDVDWIKVKLVAGASYTFGASAAAGDDGTTIALGSFQLVDAQGSALASATQLASKEQALTYKATGSGDFYLKIGAGYYGVPSSYSVTSYLAQTDAVADDSSTSAVLKIGTATKGAIDYVGDRDWFKVDLQANNYYTFSVAGLSGDGGTFDTSVAGFALQLFDAKGVSVASSYYYSGSSLSYSYGPAGTYYLQIGTAGLNTGSYTVLSSGGGAYTPDIRAPRLDTLSGPISSNGLGVAENIKLTFDESVVLGNGIVKLSLANGTLVESFDVASSARVSASYYSLTIDPLLDLLPDTDYVLEIGAGTVKDSSGNLSAASRQTFHTPALAVQLSGTAGNDVFKEAKGNAIIDGGAGLDTLVLNGKHNDYSVSVGTVYTTVTANTGSQASQSLASVERLQFSDEAVALDTRGNAGAVYRLYQAAFGRTPDKTGLGYWIAQVDKGTSLHDVAENFVTSKEFKSLYGEATTDAVFLASLYQNVLHRAGDQGGLDYWGGLLQHGVARADVLTAFADSGENQLALAYYLQDGVTYTPYL